MNSKIIITVLLIISMGMTPAMATSAADCNPSYNSYYKSISTPLSTYAMSPYGSYQTNWGGMVQYTMGAAGIQVISNTPSTDSNYYNKKITVNYSSPTILCVDMSLSPIGASLTFDKTEYSVGDIARMVISFNATNFDNNKYLYQAYLTNPATAESQVFTLTQPSSSFSQTMTTNGVWESTVWVSDRSDINQGIYNVHDQRIVSATAAISFISWQYHTSDLGALGSDGKFTYGVSTSGYDYVSTLIIRMYRNGVLVNTWNDVNNFGTMYYPLTQSGTYEVKLIQSIAYVETILKTDSNLVKAPQSYINSSKATYSTSESVVISGAMYPDTTEKNYYYVIISHYQSTTSVSSTKLLEYAPYTFSQTYNLPVGRYTASLYGYSTQCVVDGDSICMHEKDYVTFDVTESLVNNQHPINISWVKTSEKLWVVAWVSYQNSSVSDTIKIYDNAGKEFKSWSTAMYPYTLGVQLPQEPKYIGNWSAKIINGSNAADVKYSYLQVISASQQNFSNDVGVSMDWDTPVGTPGMHELTWNTGTYSGSYYIKLVDGVTGVYVNQYQYTTGTSKAQHQSMYLSGTTTVYTAQFMSGNDTILSSANIEINKNVVVVPTPPGGNTGGNIPPITGISPAANGLINTLSMTALYGLIIWIGLVFAGIRAGANGTGLIAVVWLSGVMIALIGLFDPFKIYIIVLSTMIAAVLFRSGQSASGVD